MDKSESNFCDQCSCFDIRLSRFIKEPGREVPVEPIVYIGTPSEMEKRSHCVLCRLLFKACRDGPLRSFFPEFTESDGSGVSNYPVKLGGAWQAVLGHSAEQRLESPTMCLAFWPSLYTVGINSQFVVRPVSPEPGGHPYFARAIASPFLDIGLVKRWMNKCEITHAGTPCDRKSWSSSNNSPGDFNGAGWTLYTIDVLDFCVVQHKEPPRYLALSYCWGPQTQLLLKDKNFISLTRLGGLHNYTDQIPATIIDAISLTARLGERYLWVDSLCIIQDQETTRDTTINNMHNIYSHASLVIIAAAGSRASDGLAGVNSPRKVYQFIETCYPGMGLCAQFNFKDYLRQSVYSTRGWTFQEQQLAGRTLIFINNQVYFSCLSGTFTEDVITEDCPKPDHSLYFAASSQRVISKRRDFVRQYRQSVNLYTLRTLGIASDIERAFQGVLSFYTERMIGPHNIGAQSLQGIPRSIFDVGLLWQPTKMLQRRDRFPSWSWTGWSGGVRWYNDGLSNPIDNDDEGWEKEMISEWLAKRTWIDWHWGLCHNRRGLSYSPVWGTHELSWGQSNSDTTTELSKQVTSPWGYQKRSDERYGRLLPGRPRFHNLPRVHLDLVEDDDTQNGYLRPQLYFWTASARFTIRPTYIGPIRYRASDPEELGDGLVVFLLVNCHNRPCGYVLLDETWRPKAESEQEFIMLSEGEYYMDYRRPHREHPYPERSPDGGDYLEYYTMMIMWKDGLASRAGLGRVMKAALEDACAGPEWKEIRLV